jgi:hypothetical protein
VVHLSAGGCVERVAELFLKKLIFFKKKSAFIWRYNSANTGKTRWVATAMIICQYTTSPRVLHWPYNKLKHMFPDERAAERT